jgi:hypothetical protein
LATRQGPEHRPDPRHPQDRPSRENIAAVEVSLSDADITDIDARSAHLAVAGARGSGHENYG